MAQHTDLDQHSVKELVRRADDVQASSAEAAHNATKIREALELREGVPPRMFDDAAELAGFCQHAAGLADALSQSIQSFAERLRA